MSQKKISQVILDKGFRFFDIVVYGCIILMTIIFFCVFVFFKGEKHFDGIQILYRGECIFTYEFASDHYVILADDFIEIISKDQLCFEVKIYSAENEYNIICIDKQHECVYMLDANCSFRKDCVHMNALSCDNLVPISCVPHAILIVALDYTVDNGTIYG